MASADPAAHEPARRRRRGPVLGLVALAVVGAVTGGLALANGGGSGPDGPASAGTARVTKATVRTTDLSDTKELGGTLGFGAERPLKGAGKGVVTWLPKSGATVGRGRTLYKVDDRPVPVFFGATPLFRKLEKGATGGDVKVVADNLRALGYDIDRVPGGGTEGTSVTDSGADRGRFTAALSAAIKRWQKRIGMAQTGTFDVGDIVVMPGPVRVGAVRAQLGADAGEELMTLTSTAKAVTVSVAATETGTFGEGTKVTVVLPDGKEAPGRVTAVSRTATGGDQPDSGLPGGGPAKVDVTVELDSATAVEDLDSASVRVRFTAETRKGVLAVPVGALLALSEGGYAVQRPDGTLIAVETGMFSRGLVEVRGAGLKNGTEVVTAS
ncbi:peptidoglycan-binding protein [Streptomyces sp. 2RAF24]|uniref:hypothetical protein n=1 Tax=Streptomyces sp. 2RAF24 TaxID=3232997 RepID=UPI003F96721B